MVHVGSTPILRTNFYGFVAQRQSKFLLRTRSRFQNSPDPPCGIALIYDELRTKAKLREIKKSLIVKMVTLITNGLELPASIISCEMFPHVGVC